MPDSVQCQSPKIRNSGVELLKVFAIHLIIISHCTQTMEQLVDYHIASANVQYIVLDWFRHFGTVGNIIFVICSAYFLVDSTRAKKEKVVNLLLDSQLISVLGLVFSFVVLTTLHIDGDFSSRQILRCCFPDVFNVLWFIPAYVCLYLAHPFLNKIIHSISKRQHFAICFWLWMIFGALHLFKIIPDSSNFLSFFWVYFIVAYMKKYCGNFTKNRKANLCLFFTFFCVFVGVVVFKKVLALRFPALLLYPDLTGNVSVVLLPMGLSLFNLFSALKFQSRFVNFLSGCSLFVYCIHESIYMRELFRPKFYSLLIERFGESHLLLFVLVLIVLVSVGAFVAAALYKITLHRLTAKVSPILKNKVAQIVNFAFSVFEKQIS